LTFGDLGIRFYPMCKFYNAIKCFVFISFSLSLLRADLVLNEKNIQTIENLSKKEIFQEEDVYKCFSLFGFNDSKFYFFETAKEIKQILERGKTDALGYEILANLQKVLAKFLVYDIQHLNIQPVDVDSAETCFQSFNNVLENQAKILIRNTFYKRKEDFFKTFIKNNRVEIVNLSKNGEFNEGLVKQCFRLFINEDVDDFTNDQVYKNCINVLVGLIGVEYLNNQSGILFPLQKILKNLLVFYMQQFDELSIKSFYCKFKDLLQSVLRICPEVYKSELKECFCRLLNDSRRVELTPKEEIDSFDKLDKGIYKSKGDCAFALQHFGGAKENLKLLRSASIYLDRFPSSEDSLLNKFIFFSVKKGEGKVVIPQIYCFLSLESRDVDLTAFSICLYNKKSNFSNFGKCEEVFLYPQVEDNKFCFLEEIRVSMLEKVDASRISSSAMLDPSFNALISEDLFRVKKQKFLEINKDNKKSISLDLKTCGEKNIFCGLLWKSCLQEKNAEVQHVLTNYSLGQSKIGDKFLYIKDSINREKQEQQLEIRVHVFATDELLFKALQNFVSQQERQFPEPMFLDYNEQKGCFELLDVSHFQSKKKAIYGKLVEKHEALKNCTESIVNQQKIDELMDILLKQRESDTEELDVGMVREMESLLQKAEQRLEFERKEKAELKRQQEEAEQQLLEKERLEREEAERVRKAEEERKRKEAEEQRRREEEASKPKGVTGQQIFDYIQRTGTPKKKNCAIVAKNRNVIVPATLYTDPNQLPLKYRQYFSIIMSEQN